MTSGGWDYKTKPENFNKFIKVSRPRTNSQFCSQPGAMLDKRVKHLLLTAKTMVAAGKEEMNEC